MFTEQQIVEASSAAKAKDMIAANIAACDIWLVRAILAIYKCQTNDEQSSQFTKYHNGIGFNGLDSNILSSFAEQIKRWFKTAPSERKFDAPLSPKQMGIARKKMAKYAGQLASIARERSAQRELVAA